ncbi:tripartite motif-containing protein 3-like [Dipodomys merriami]|uniref:tripartite motif-containing protein 3-like n=1 Tax=Dipodomys merriami TaxID=94247 RepID=UPI003855BA06
MDPEVALERHSASEELSLNPAWIPPAPASSQPPPSPSLLPAPASSQPQPPPSLLPAPASSQPQPPPSPSLLPASSQAQPPPSPSLLPASSQAQPQPPPQLQPQPHAPTPPLCDKRTPTLPPERTPGPSSTPAHSAPNHPAVAEKLSGPLLPSCCPLASWPGLWLTLDPPAGPRGSPRPRLLGRIPVPLGAVGELRGLHCSPDGLLFLTAGSRPFVHVLDLEGHALCHLPCRRQGAGAFVPEDVAVTAAGLVVVSDLVHGAVHALQHTRRAPQGHWATVGTFLSPRGLAVDALGRFLVADYLRGSVHSFTLGPTRELLAPAVILGLEGPCWVGPGPDGGLAVTEEFGSVWLFGSARQPLGSLGARTGHTFGRPAGVCSDSEGNVIVADQRRRQVTLFPRVGPPICLLSEGLERPLGVACAPQGRLVVADAGDNCIKIYQHLGPGGEPQ